MRHYRHDYASAIPQTGGMALPSPVEFSSAVLDEIARNADAQAEP